MPRPVNCLYGILLLIALSQAHAQVQLPLLGVGASAACSQASTFVARTSGENNAALTTFICGLVAAGMIDNNASMASTGGNTYCGSGSVFDRLFIMQMANSTDALLDVCGHTSATNTGTTFAANQGFTGGAAQNNTAWIDSQFDPSSGTNRYVQNSAHVGCWILTNVSNTDGMCVGLSDTVNSRNTWINEDAGGSAFVRINENSPSTSAAVATAKGDWILSRTAASTATLYQNASVVINDTATSSGVPQSHTFYILNQDIVGSTGSHGDPNQVAIAHIGAAMTSGQATTFQSLGCSYLTAVSGSC